MKVLLVEDHPIIVAGCRAILSDIENLCLLVAETGAAGLELFRQEAPDVAIFDVNLPDLSGFELAHQIVAEFPRAAILIFAMNDATFLATRAIMSGARGFICKRDQPDRFRQAVITIARGETFLPDGMAQEVALMRLGRSSQTSIDRREAEILHHLAAGHSLREAAAVLGISYRTASLHCSSLRRKLNAKTQIELMRIAIENNLV